MTREKMWEDFETSIKDVVERWKKVLEQEPCEDCISRQAVLDAIMANNIWENEYNLTSSRIKKAVESLPSVKPQELKWIPCTERMPEKSGFYLVSGRGKVWIYEMLDIMGLKGWCGELGRPIVEAWMPLPEPYKEEVED